MEKIKNYFKAIFGGTAVVLGIIAIIFGSSVSYYGGYEHENAYGGDAYTGIQNAAAQTANNVDNFGDAYIESYSFGMYFIGITMITGGALAILYNVADVKTRKKGEQA